MFGYGGVECHVEYCPAQSRAFIGSLRQPLSQSTYTIPTDAGSVQRIFREPLLNLFNSDIQYTCSENFYPHSKNSQLKCVDIILVLKRIYIPFDHMLAQMYVSVM